MSVTHEEDITLHYVDQETAAVKSTRAREGLVIGFSLAKVTLERYAKMMNDAIVTQDVGPPSTRRFPLHKGRDVARFAFLVRGPSPYGDFNLQYEVPIVIQTENPAIAYNKEEKSVLACQLTALFDENDAEGGFGVVRAQDA